MSINKISAQFKHRKLTVASSTVLLGTLQHFPVSVSQLCPQPFETFKTDKLRCKVHSKKHSDEGSDKKIKQKTCFQLFLASVEGQILVSTIKNTGAATNSSTAARKSPVMPLWPGSQSNIQIKGASCLSFSLSWLTLIKYYLMQYDVSPLYSKDSQATLKYCSHGKITWLCYILYICDHTDLTYGPF